MSKIDEEELRFDIQSELFLTFELCKDEFYCVDDPEAELQGKIFKFPSIHQIFDADMKDASKSLIREPDDNLIYPYIPD